MPKEVIEEKSITLEEVQEALKENEKNGELSYTQRVTLDYATKFSQIPLETAKKLVDDLCKEFGLDLDTAIEIVNAMPTSLGELRTFLVGGKDSNLDQDKQKDVLEKIKKAMSH